MKKIIIALVLIIFVTGCSLKQNLSSEQFVDLLEKSNFYVTNIKSKYENYDEIKNVYIAQDKSMKYQIEFYELSSISSAKKLYEGNVKEVKKDTNITNKVLDENNYSKYIQETKDKYQIVSRIDNTVIYIESDKKYKNEIDKILKLLNY